MAHLRAAASRYPARVDGRRVAIVTGGATGIGRTISEGLAADGLAVVVGYFGNEAGAAATARAIETGGGEVRLVRGDAGDPAAGAALVDAALTSFGRLDVLCGHAGLTLFRGFLEMEPEAFDRLVATNLRGRTSRHRPQRAGWSSRAQGGRIVLTSSVTAQRAIAGAVGVRDDEGRDRGARPEPRDRARRRRDHGQRGDPGSIVNERNLADDPAYAERWAALNPVGRVGSGADVLAAIRFLIGPDAGFITGSDDRRRRRLDGRRADPGRRGTPRRFDRGGDRSDQSSNVNRRAGRGWAGWTFGP